MAHTPGPWTAKNLSEHGGYDCMYAGIEIEAGETTIATLDLSNYGQNSCGPLPERTPEAEANAKLIAAAPEMVAEIERLRAFLERIGEIAYAGHADGRETRLEMIERYARNALIGAQE